MENNFCWMVCGGTPSHPIHDENCASHPDRIELDLSLKLHATFSDFYCKPDFQTSTELLKAMRGWRKFHYGK